MADLPDTQAPNKTHILLIMVVITAILGGWVTMIQRTGNSVLTLTPQIEAMQITIAKHDQWIADWPTNGELAADVKQNAEIQYMRDDLNTLNIERAKTSERLTRLEERQAAMHSDVKKLLEKLDKLLTKKLEQ